MTTPDHPDAEARGYVPLAIHVLQRADLKDLDKLLFMAITHDARFVEPRDGISGATNKHLAEFIGGRSVDRVAESIARLEAAKLIRRLMANANTRIGIEVLFDPFGAATIPGYRENAAPSEGYRENAAPGTAKTRHLKTAECRENAAQGTAKTRHRYRENAVPHPIETFEAPETSTTTSGYRENAVPQKTYRENAVPSEGYRENAVPVIPISETSEADYSPDVRPVNVDQLVSWAGVWFPEEAAQRSIPNWFLQLKQAGYDDEKSIDWILDALNTAVPKAETGEGDKGTLYANGCLRRWLRAKGRPPVEKVEEEEARIAEANRPAIDREAEAKARAVQEAREVAAREASLKVRWERLDVRERDSIKSAVAKAMPHLNKWPNVLEAEYLREFAAHREPARPT